ncbi:MAG TPA: hypothetical protein VFH80_12935 [Solirubrobacteraceae bacterium]|nr:hypothetical protein [Solirubrobacteraceae bacterium]
MTSWIGLLSVFADIVILLALAVAVASRRVSQLARLVIATFTFACAWIVGAGFDAIGVRGWTLFVSGAVIVVSIGVVTATLHLWTLGCDGAPSWWPDFERQFADYVAEREHYV